MSRLAENLSDIFKVVNKDNDIWRLLYYPTDPLNPSKVNVQTLTDFTSKISKQRIIRSPKSDDLTTEPICRICMYFGNGSSVNRAFSEQDIVFDVYAHIDNYDKNDARSLKIIDRLITLLDDEHITGIGRMKSSKMYVIGNPPTGYIGYKMVFSFGSVK